MSTSRRPDLSGLVRDKTPSMKGRKTSIAMRARMFQMAEAQLGVAADHHHRRPHVGMDAPSSPPLKD